MAGNYDAIARAMMFDPKRIDPGAGGFGSGSPNVPRGMFGYDVRNKLFPGEDEFFKGNKNVAGMAAETGDVILNPYSPPSVDHQSVAQNEAMRLLMRDSGISPDYSLTPSQRAPFVGTPYGSDDPALKSSIAARIYSGDPSAQATPEQMQWVDQFLNSRFLKR